MVDTLEDNAARLGTTPFIGIELLQDEYPMLTPGYRMLVANPFNMYYRIVGDMVYITHVVHHRRNQAKALAGRE